VCAVLPRAAFFYATERLTDARDREAERPTSGSISGRPAKPQRRSKTQQRTVVRRQSLTSLACRNRPVGKLYGIDALSWRNVPVRAVSIPPWQRPDNRSSRK